METNTMSEAIKNLRSEDFRPEVYIKMTSLFVMFADQHDNAYGNKKNQNIDSDQNPVFALGLRAPEALRHGEGLSEIHA